MANKTILSASLLTAVVLCACATSAAKNSSAEAPRKVVGSISNGETATAKTKVLPTLAWDMRDDDNDRVRNRDDKCPNSDSRQDIAPSGCPVPPHGVRGWVEFDPGSYALRLDTIAILDENIVLLKSFKGRIKIVGHSDSCEAPKNRQELSLRRSHAVARYLFSQGVRSSQIAFIYGAGDTTNLNNKPADDCKGGYNRTVELEPAID